jgi:4-amino-4-deoxy-L-arabinose transferase-like glycosyltransferase
MPAFPLLRRSVSSYARLLSWAAIAWIVVFWRLGYPSLMDPDEAHYAELTREMLRAGRWMVPLLDGQPFIDKPILFHWLQGAAMALLGETEFAARLPSALAAIALFWTTRRAGILMFGASVGEWGAIMLATIPSTFALASIGLFDMIFTALLFGALTCLLEATATSSRPREIAGYALLSFAVMIKGPVALVLVGLFSLAAWAIGGVPRARVAWLRWKTGLIAAAVGASPWFVWMFAHFGDAFVQGYVLAGNIYYFTQPEAWSGRAINHTFYLRSFAGGFFPWSALALARLVELARRRMTAGPEETLLWIWSAVVIGFFSLARFKLDHYIFPAAPAICLIASKAWHDAAAAARRDRAAVRSVAIGLGALLVVAGAFIAVYIFELGLELPESAILLPIALGAGGTAMLERAARFQWRLPPNPIVLVTTLLSVYTIVVAVGLPTLEHVRPTALVARTLRTHAPPDAPAAIYRLEQWRASLRYYAERPLAGLSTSPEVTAFLADAEARYIIMRRRDYRAIRNEGFKLREVFRCRAVVGTRRVGGGLRQQEWGELMIVTNKPRGYWLP